jgi:hypothetical protein
MVTQHNPRKQQTWRGPTPHRIKQTIEDHAGINKTNFKILRNDPSGKRGAELRILSRTDTYE